MQKNFLLTHMSVQPRILLEQGRTALHQGSSSVQVTKTPWCVIRITQVLENSTFLLKNTKAVYCASLSNLYLMNGWYFWHKCIEYKPTFLFSIIENIFSPELKALSVFFIFSAAAFCIPVLVIVPLNIQILSTEKQQDFIILNNSGL